jgi:hypothetical protein
VGSKRNKLARLRKLRREAKPHVPPPGYHRLDGPIDYVLRQLAIEEQQFGPGGRPVPPRLPPPPDARVMTPDEWRSYLEIKSLQERLGIGEARTPFDHLRPPISQK